MKEGKLNWDDLTELISQNRGYQRDEVRVKSGVGEDCTVITFGDEECVLSTDPITGAEEGIGKIAFNINMNDIASSGAEPVGILVTILAPVGTSYEKIIKVMNEIHTEAVEHKVEIVGGHTEITSAVNRMVVSCTAIGKNKKGDSVATKGCELGDSIVVTKELCLEGTAILAFDYKEKIDGVIHEEKIKEAQGYADQLSVLREGRIAMEFGVSSMHDITEGGLLGALWEVIEAAGKGFRVYRESLPITDVTAEFCEFFNVDPLKFISSGSMLITCKDGEGLIERLKENGIKGTIIGKVTGENGILVDNEKEIIVEAPESDELFKIEV